MERMSFRYERTRKTCCHSQWLESAAPKWFPIGAESRQQVHWIDLENVRPHAPMSQWQHPLRQRLLQCQPPPYTRDLQDWAPIQTSNFHWAWRATTSSFLADLVDHFCAECHNDFSRLHCSLRRYSTPTLLLQPTRLSTFAAALEALEYQAPSGQAVCRRILSLSKSSALVAQYQVCYPLRKRLSTR